MENIPMEATPPGVTSNFEDPVTRAPLIIGVIATCLALLWPIFAARLYTKLWITRSFGWDDASSILATMLTTAYAGAVIWEMTILGPHGWDIRASAITPTFSAVSVGVTLMVFGPAIFFAKLSIFLLYLRLFGPDKWVRYLSYAGIAASLAVYSSTTLGYGILCVRRPGDTWLETQLSDRCLAGSKPLLYIQAVFGLVSDLYIFFLPVPVVWRLQMPVRRRIGVLVIFTTGILAVISSILGLWLRCEAAVRADIVWTLPPTLLLAIVEMSVGVMCGCMPYLASFFRRHRISLSLTSSFKRLFSRGTSRSSESEKKHFRRVGSDPPKDALRLDANVLGTMKGDGAFLKSGNFKQKWLQRSSMTDPLRSQSGADKEVTGSHPTPWDRRF